MENCIFCKIIAGELPCKKVAENDYCIAIHDINPQVNTHILVISKKHTTDIIDAVDNYPKDVMACLDMCNHIVKELGFDKKGFRLSTNHGKDGCQSINHLHFHILGGEQLSEKMA